LLTNLTLIVCIFTFYVLFSVFFFDIAVKKRFAFSYYDDDDDDNTDDNDDDDYDDYDDDDVDDDDDNDTYSDYTHPANEKSP